jgi:broad specificity phosphatase PhoE
LRQRVGAAWDRWLADACGGHRLLLTHAGVMHALLLDLLGLPESHLWRIALAESGYFRVSWLAGHDPVLLELNGCAA